jgi:hypothetical protein
MQAHIQDIQGEEDRGNSFLAIIWFLLKERFDFF